MGGIVMALNNSRAYREQLAQVAAVDRDLASRYLLAEIDVDEPFGIVEYWGRGYTQGCMVRILESALGREVDVPFYYPRSIYPSEGRSIRHNLTSESHSLIVIEAIFANLPHGTVEGYRDEGGVVVPVTSEREYGQELYEAMNTELPRFATEFAKIEFLDPDSAYRDAFRAGFIDFAKHAAAAVYIDRIAHLAD